MARPEPGTSVKVDLPLMVQDPMTTQYPGVLRTVEGLHLTVPDEHDIADGPALPDLRVLDRDLDTGVDTPAVHYLPPDGRRKMGRFALSKPYDIYDPHFIQAASFAAVAKTLRSMDVAGAVGHPWTWSDPGRPLTIMPRAGRMPNALYDRAGQSLRFFYFPHPGQPDRTIYTALSRDIVAHETAHAVVDGIAPTLFDTCTPQTLAIQESVADLCAVMTAFQSGTLTHAVLEHTGGFIEDSAAFSTIAAEVGAALSTSGLAPGLRNLSTDARLVPVTDSVGADAQCEPYQLSLALSGLLYGLMVELVDRDSLHSYSRSGWLLAMNAQWFQRALLQSVDLLPPADCSLAEFVQCFLTVAFLESAYWFRGPGIGGTDYQVVGPYLLHEADRRGLAVSDPIVTSLPFPIANDGDRLLDDGVAAAWVEANRTSLGIPVDVDLETLRPYKADVHREAQGTWTWVSLLVVKARWQRRELMATPVNGVTDRVFHQAVTIVFDRRADRHAGYVLRGGWDDLRRERDAFFATLGGSFVRGGGEASPPARSSVHEVGRALHLSGAGALLHAHTGDDEQLRARTVSTQLSH